MSGGMQIGLFQLWKDIFQTNLDVRPSIRQLLLAADDRPQEETRFRPTTLWERAREVLMEEGITRTEEIWRDGTWCIQQVPKLTQAMTVGLMHQLQLTDWED
eukprot:709728-Rhodomonas_salina.2